MIRLNKSGLNICGNYYVEQLVNYVRKNNYPHMKSEEVYFADQTRYALCSELDLDDHSATVECLERGLYHPEDGEYLSTFEGGVYIVHGISFTVLVDDHLYFFNF